MATRKCTCENCRVIGKGEYAVIVLAASIPVAFVYYLISEIMK